MAQLWAVERAYRPQLARSALQQRVVHCKRQARLAVPAARRQGTTRAQRVVEVGRVHLRALVRRARAQPRQRADRTAPRLHQRAIAGTVLQASRVKTIVERSDIHRTSRRAQRRVADALPSVAAADRSSGAMHRRRDGLATVGLAAANLEAAVRDGALDEQIGRLDGERLHKVHATQSCCRRRTRHLEVARARKDDAALHDVVGDEGVKRARGRRAEDNGAIG